MGFGTNGEGGAKTTFFKINGLKQGSKPEELYFKGQHYVDEKITELETHPTFLEGVIKSITTSNYEYEGDTVNNFKIVLVDSQGEYVLESNFSNLAIGILNTLAGAETLGKVKLALYTNKSGYQSVYITMDDSEELPKWKWDYKKDIAKRIETIKNSKGKVVSTDKSELEEFLTKHINSKEFQGKIVGDIPVIEPVTVKAPDVSDKVGGDDDSGLPF